VRTNAHTSTYILIIGKMVNAKTAKVSKDSMPLINKQSGQPAMQMSGFIKSKIGVFAGHFNHREFS